MNLGNLTFLVKLAYCIWVAGDVFFFASGFEFQVEAVQLLSDRISLDDIFRVAPHIVQVLTYVMIRMSAKEQRVDALFIPASRTRGITENPREADSSEDR